MVVFIVKTNMTYIYSLFNVSYSFGISVFPTLLAYHIKT